jgi:hypothetical protein
VTKRKFGWRKDERRETDFLVRHPPTIPAATSLKVCLPSARDQGETSACVGFGIAALLTAVRTRERAATVGGFSTKADWFSPLWVYNGARELEDCIKEDAGCMPRDALRWLAKRGCLLEADWPFDPKHPDLSRPPVSFYHPASEWPITRYFRCVDGIRGIMSAIATGHPVALGVPWFEKWLDVGALGTLMPVSAGDPIAGGHETCLFAYDQKRGVFGDLNSWGPDWGRNGTCEIPFEAFDVFKQVGGYDAWCVEADWGKA